MENFTGSVIEKKNLELDSNALNYLKKTRKWSMFLSILGFVLVGLMFLIVVIIMGTGNSLSPGLHAVTIILLLLMCGIYFFPIYFLYRFSAYSKLAINREDHTLLAKALMYLKMHYQFMGILAIIVAIIYIIMIPIVFLAGDFLKTV
ncbi:MAG: hypothetical protein AB2L24_12850 [Mangrovibacterium sp.]